MDRPTPFPSHLPSTGTKQTTYSLSLINSIICYTALDWLRHLACLCPPRLCVPAARSFKLHQNLPSLPDYHFIKTALLPENTRGGVCPPQLQPGSTPHVRRHNRFKMIGWLPNSMTTHVPILIVGAGISGLVCAYSLRKAGIGAQIVEASPHPGG